MSGVFCGTCGRSPKGTQQSDQFSSLSQTTPALQLNQVLGDLLEQLVHGRCDFVWLERLLEGAIGA